jgi:hypothetical protein
MSTISLDKFEKRLQQEIPVFAWQCKPTQHTDWIAGTELPEGIEISASEQGAPVPGTPLFLSGQMLVRWGMDSSARLICNEITPMLTASQMKAGMSWDKLGEF